MLIYLLQSQTEIEAIYFGIERIFSEVRKVIFDCVNR